MDTRDKNSIQRVKDIVHLKEFKTGIDPSTAFVFSNREDGDEFPFVGNGEDEQPLILGITTLKLLRNILVLQQKEPFLLSTWMQLLSSAILAIHQRTERDYYQAIRSFVKQFQKHMKSQLRVDAVMSDAESGQMKALRNIAGFEKSTHLMCFFHVLYNIRKHIRHLPDSLRVVVYRGILDMHYALSEGDLVSIWNCVESEWRSDTRLWSFTNYFYTQWLCSSFWRWQIYHSPGGFATANNPCEVFNASIKRYTLRKAVDTRRLILKLLTIAEDSSMVIECPSTTMRPTPPQDAKKLAKVLVSSERVAVFSTNNEFVVRVCYLGDQDGNGEMNHNITSLDGDRIFDIGQGGGNTFLECLTDIEKKVACSFYRRLSGLFGEHIMLVCQATDGLFECSCPYYNKFLSCAHVICGRMAFGLRMPGVGGLHLKFKDRRVRRNNPRGLKNPARLVLHNVNVGTLYHRRSVL
ncbi:LOW QUALITY PROTEIN: hypothetical protein PHPALM_30779 [Phytophthora palmivora]|uniref:SWIM-type domain-containing protein n=1 Tax=Phytophthora palmivora TaxID=4796 RepID=A0A2P4X492_9STRA|nr:LOW QUALITY PROTEIN: hypothetical protein PHPALM_30779 [Phytophthora palmivora]